MEKEVIISANGLEYTYANGTKALCGITLDIHKGERVAVLGANGSGKSTLFLCFNGVYRAGAGQVRFAGETVEYNKKSLLALRKNVGVVFQDPETQLFCVDVYQEVAFGPYNLGWEKERVERCTLESLAAMDLLPLRDKPPHFLSGGQKKRVTVASVLSMEPSVLLFDEPVAALDPAHARQLMEEMDKLSARGVTILMATHDVDGALSWADRAVVLSEGSLMADAPPAMVFQDEKLLARCGLETPAVLHMWGALKARGILPEGNPPRSVFELEEKIMQLQPEL